MKKFIILGLAGLSFSACMPSANIQGGAKQAVSNANAKMQTCMLTEATRMLTDGSIYNQNIKTTAKTISNICLQRLALEALPAEYQAMAEIVINSVKAGKEAANNK